MVPPSPLPSRLARLALLLFVGGPLLAHLEVVRPLAGFGLYLIGAVFGLATLGTTLLAARRSGFAPLRVPFAIGLGLTVLLLASALPGRGVPRINDITTDFDNPPVFVSAATLPENAGRDLSWPGASFAAQQRQGYPDLEPLVVPLSPDGAFGLVVATARQRPEWTLSRVEPAARQLEGFATSRLFRFRDDFVVEVRFHPAGSVVHMRSKSRDGKGDLGVNADRIRRFLGDLAAAIRANPDGGL